MWIRSPINVDECVHVGFLEIDSRVGAWSFMVILLFVAYRCAGKVYAMSA